MTTQNFSFILGSSSAPRKELLVRLRIPFHIVVPDVDETPLPHESALQLVRRLAEIKARKVAAQFPEALIIGGDQVGVCDGEIMGKPGSHENAVKQLQTLSGNQITFYSGLCLFNARENRAQIEIVPTHITFRHLTTVMIEHYLSDGQPYNCAGSLMMEKLGIVLIEESRSPDPTAILGLPLIALTSMLMKEGVNPLGGGAS